MFIARDIPQAPPATPLHLSFTLLPTSSVIAMVSGTVYVRCVFGTDHAVAVTIRRVVSHRADPDTMNVTEAVIHGKPGADTEFTWHLIHTHLLSDWVDPCIDEAAHEIMEEGGALEP